MLLQKLKNKSKLIRKRSWHRFKIFFCYRFKRVQKEPTFIIATRRTGSEFLVDCLNSVPNVSFAGEILNKSMGYGIRRRFITKRAVMRHILHSVNSYEHRVCGAKFVRTQMNAHRLSVLDLKQLFPNAKFIILYRQSLLDQFVSLKIAELTDIWRWTADFQLPQTLAVSIPELKRFCEDVKNFYRLISQNVFLKDCSVTLKYEEFIKYPQNVFDELLFPFLGLPRSLVFSHLRKQNIKKLPELVENYDEVIRSVDGNLLFYQYPSLFVKPRSGEISGSL